jgi:uncharacterized protein
MRLAREWRWTVCASVALLALLALPLIARLRLDPDVLNLLPRSGTAVRAFRTYLSDFGSFDRVYIVFEAPEGESIDNYSSLVDRYADALRHDRDFSRVDTQMFEPGKDWTYVLDHVFALIGPRATAEALGRLSPDGMPGQIAQARGRLAVPSPAMSDLVRQDPFDFLGLLRQRLSAANAFVRVDPTAEGYVSSDRRARLIIAAPNGPPFDLAFSRHVEARLRAIEAAVRAQSHDDADVADLPAVGIRYAGGYHLAIEAEKEVRTEAVFNLVTSLGGILILLLVVFRSPWLFVVGALPMAIGGLLSAAVNGLFERNLSAAAAGASALLFGLGIDGLVLLYARYLEERPTSATAAEAVKRLGGAGTSMLLGMVTSAATFLALVLVQFPSLRELGRLIGLGMLFGGILTAVLVPALLPDRVKARRSLTAYWLVGLVQRRRRPILWVAGAVTVLLAAAAPALRLDLTLQRLQPKTPQLAFEREVARRFGLPEDLVVILSEGRDLPTLLAANQRLVDDLARTGKGVPIFSATSLLPPEKSQSEVADVVAASQLSPEELRTRLDAAAEEAGFKPGVFAPFLARAPKLLDPSSRLTFDGYVQHGLGDLLSPYVVRTREGFAVAAYARPRSHDDVEAVRAAVSHVGGPLRATGIPIVNDEMASRLIPQFLVGVALGAVVVFGLMWATFRNIRLTVLALVPTVLALVWSAGLLALCGVAVDLFSMFGVLMFIGIGVDYGIHLVHRYGAEGDIREALARVAPVNLVAAGIAVLGCGTLITSDYPPLQSLGVVSVVTLVTCLVGSLLVLPASLETWARPTHRS